MTITRLKTLQTFELLGNIKIDIDSNSDAYKKLLVLSWMWNTCSNQMYPLRLSLEDMQ